MIEIGLAHYLGVAAILFTLGIFGIFLNRKNVIGIRMRWRFITELCARVTRAWCATERFLTALWLSSVRNR